MDRKVFQAYVATDSQSGKRYVGITGRGLRQRWNEHLSNARHKSSVSLLDLAIGKRGVVCFSVEVVCESSSWAEICAVEAALIRQFNTRHPNGYNMSAGGEGPFGVKRSPESVERSAAKHRGRPCHPNTRRVSSEFHKGRKKQRRAAGAFKTTTPYANHGKSTARKAASAMIAKIPLVLSRHIAQVYYPQLTRA